MAESLIDGRAHRVRLIAPGSGEGSTATVLGRTYGFTELPLEHLPDSAGLVDGSYTLRLGDSGEFNLRFPNAAGRKGLWRETFDPDLALQFVEIYRDDVLEFVGNVQRVEIDRGVVSVSGVDAWALTRRAFEKDRAWTAAPRDVIEAYTRVPLPLIADDFDGVALDAAWTVASGSTSVSDGAVTLSGATARMSRSFGATLGDTWRIEIVLRALTGDFSVEIDAYPALVYFADLEQFAGGHTATLNGLGFTPGRTFPTGQLSFPCTLIYERKGRWASLYANGTLISFSAVAISASFTTLTLLADSTVTIESVYVSQLTSFLERGSDKGDYVLPADQPSGGLRGRYWNDADMQGYSAAQRRDQMLAPNRDSYAERLDTIIDSGTSLNMPLQPGNSGDYFSVRWFGSVYLRGDLGNYTFEVTSVTDGVRLYVGKTNWGDELIDDWTLAAGTDTATWTAANYGSDAGWYPIVLEFYCDTNPPFIQLKFTPPGTGYTDPGGTSIVASTKRVIPTTSLSPLGCFDNRVQGTTHFDVVQQAAQQFGYQLTCEPLQLESGEFPGRVVPRLRVGRDTDVIIETEDTDRVDPALSPGMTLDSSDQAVRVVGSGAGLPNIQGSQVTAETTDLALSLDALFTLESQVDSTDIAFPALLGARLDAELALRSTPWEEVRATPRAQEKLADTWPLSAVLSAMRWRPGDAVRLRVPDIGVEDASPRQILQVTRNFAPEGRTGTQVSFRQRPRSAASSLRRLIRAAMSPQRSYQGQKVTLVTPMSAASAIAAAGFTDYGRIALFPTDTVVKAMLRVSANTAAVSIGVEINGTDRSAALGGGWTNVPLDIDVTAYATQVSTTDNQFYARFQNNGGVATIILFQVVVEILR